MKRILSVIVFVLSAFISKAQFPITQNLGSSSTLVQVPANGGLRASLINRTFTDTTAANITAIKYYPFAMIGSSSNDAMWFRNAAATKWIQLLPSADTSGEQAWLSRGNLFPVLPADLGVGTNDETYLPFKTFGVRRATIPALGISRVSNPVYKYLVIDTSGSDHVIGYSDAASIANEWHLTGNSSTVAGTNYIGTNDAVGLMFKTNGVQSGYIDIVMVIQVLAQNHYPLIHSALAMCF